MEIEDSLETRIQKVEKRYQERFKIDGERKIRLIEIPFGDGKKGCEQIKIVKVKEGRVFKKEVETPVVTDTFFYYQQPMPSIAPLNVEIAVHKIDFLEHAMNFAELWEREFGKATANIKKHFASEKDPNETG